VIRPPALRAGAGVALVAPAGPLAPEAVDRALERVSAWGWEPLLAPHARGRAGYFSGTDLERSSDFNAALRDPRVDAIWCLRGGYGTMRIMSEIDWAVLVARPRPVIGFSDNTALHLAIQRRGIVSFHAPHPAAVDFPAFSADLLRDALTIPEPAGLLPFPSAAPGPGTTVTGGVAEGPLVGGNLSLLAATLATSVALRPEGAILFLEEIGEPGYRIDRLLTQLRLAGTLKQVAGIAVGAMTDAPAETAGMPSTAEIIRDRLGDLGIPVAMEFPFGHVPENWTLPLGVRARLDADAGTLTLLEPAVE
jgi:muramoyltetrapeptide carboxypeptidase